MRSRQDIMTLGKLAEWIDGWKMTLKVRTLRFLTGGASAALSIAADLHHKGA